MGRHFGWWPQSVSMRKRKLLNNIPASYAAASGRSQNKNNSDNRVNALFRDRTGNLWVATQNCLNLFNPKDSSLTAYRNDQTITNPSGNTLPAYRKKEVAIYGWVRKMMVCSCLTRFKKHSPVLRILQKPGEPG